MIPTRSTVALVLNTVAAADFIVALTALQVVESTISSNAIVTPATENSVCSIATRRSSPQAA